MPNTIAPTQPEREVLRCPSCTLVQFKTSSGLCRRCRKPLVQTPTVLKPVRLKAASKRRKAGPRTVPKLKVVAPSVPAVDTIPRGIVLLGELRGFTQTDLGNRCNLPRSYISRIEHGHTMPSIPLLERISFALGLDLPVFLVHARNLIERDRAKHAVPEPKAA